MKVTVVGEVVIDRFIHADGTVADVAGGSSANTAIALQRSGVQTSLRARFSLDEAGRALRAHSAAEGVDLSDSPDVTDPASIVEVRLAADGQPSYVFRLAGAADWQWTDAEIGRALPTGTAAVHFGSIAAVLQPGADTLRRWVTTLAPRPLITFDPNARPAAAADEQEAAAMRAGVAAWCELADVIKVSDEDLRWCVPGVPEAETAARWSQRAAFVVMTRGAEGASVFIAGEHRFDVDPVKVAVIDTVGAGDTFMAWLIRGIVRHLEHGTLSGLAHDEAALRAIVQMAAAAAAVTVSRRGCQPPTAGEIPGA